ncbi:MAG: hypothetical protein IJS57_02670 [Paludibacteraceae bacterium]|nr:hypothetical protein [Paludibacteraceae bacterium]
MKALRYLLIVMMLSVASLAFATAQSLAQQPEAQMQSTSVMVSTGSTLPSAAVQGTYVTGSTVGTYNPANASGPNRARRAADEDDDPEDPDTPPVTPHGPNENPIGDAAWLLILAAAVYGVYKRKLRVR